MGQMSRIIFRTGKNSGAIVITGIAMFNQVRFMLFLLFLFKSLALFSADSTITRNQQIAETNIVQTDSGQKAIKENHNPDSKSKNDWIPLAMFFLASATFLWGVFIW